MRGPSDRDTKALVWTLVFDPAMCSLQSGKCFEDSAQNKDDTNKNLKADEVVALACIENG